MAQSATSPIVDDFIAFFRGFYSDEISELAQQYPSEQRSLHIDFKDLVVYDHDLADNYIEEPDQMREYAEQALLDFDLPYDVKLERAHVRVYNLPETVDIRDFRVHDEHVGQLISIEGIVRKTTDVAPKIVNGAFECEHCKTLNHLYQIDSSFSEPHECQGCERQGPFNINFDQSDFIDSQQLRIQETPETLRGGETPRDIDVSLEDDLTGKVTPGSRVTVTGVLHIEESTADKDSTFFDMYIDGVSLTVDDEDFDKFDIADEEVDEIKTLVEEADDIFDKLVCSVAPSIYGYSDEKLAMILQLFSGVLKELPDGSRIRGDIHILLIGDPGTGKSALLSYVDNVAPRSVYTSGKGSSSAGLTASAVRDGFGQSQQWTLEAGALVLADKGIAAVDELDKMDSSDRSAMHEALEQQSVSISKAGITATLKSRCALLAAANPKYGEFDRMEPIPQQIDLEPALISRFDLIFPVSDSPDPETDGEVADHILDSNHLGELNEHQKHSTDTHVTQQDVDDASEDHVPEIETELLRKYVAYARRSHFPALNDAARNRIHEFYVGLRTDAAEDDGPVPITARKLEAIVRLAEASARVRLSNTITESDAVRAIGIVRTCLEEIGVDPQTEEFDADMIETGQSKRQRTNEKSVKAVIEDLDDESDDGVPFEELIGVTESMDMSEQDVREALDKLLREGVLIEPSPDQYRLIGR